jgi:hypothetical protein
MVTECQYPDQDPMHLRSEDGEIFKKAASYPFRSLFLIEGPHLQPQDWFNLNPMALV